MNREDLEKRKSELSEQEKAILFQGETEIPFSGELLHEKRKGLFTCKVCNTPLFDSQTKFESGTGWPSFDKALPNAVEYFDDTSHGMNRVEVRCSHCHAHLGHVFPDGYTETGNRFCMNSICLNFEQEK